MHSESQYLELLQPAPEERLQAWLQEFYGKPVIVERRELLRHRDLSLVERICVQDALPASLIYKQVLPPWDVEQDLHERVLIPSISNSATLYLTGRWDRLTALFMEDLGRQSLVDHDVDAEFAASVGKDLAKMHRAYSYRTAELDEVRVLRSILPADYETFAAARMRKLLEWQIITADLSEDVVAAARSVGRDLAEEPISLVHGDLYAENILLRGPRMFIIDWSWFTVIGAPIMDLATLTSTHFKNGKFTAWADTVLEAYCDESGRRIETVRLALPSAQKLSRLLFLDWLVERRDRGIMGTTVGPVDDLIAQVVAEIIRQ